MDQALAQLGLGPSVRGPVGQCALWNGRTGAPCPTPATLRAELAPAVSLQVCSACGYAIETSARDAGRAVHLAPLR